VLYALPGVVTVPSTLPLGELRPAPLPPGSTLTMNLTSVPSDLQVTIASPQFPDSGRLQWTHKFGRDSRPSPEYRVTGGLQDRQSSGQANILVAGALLGIAGGALIWALEMLTNVIAAFFGEQDDAETRSTQNEPSGTGQSQSVITTLKDESAGRFSRERWWPKRFFVISLVSLIAGYYVRRQIARRMHWSRKQRQPSA
jgi:hypothetical protein